MDVAVRNSIVKLAITFGLVCTTCATSHAYNEDIHYDATFVLAVALGFGWEQARAVASADQAVDHNLFTKPTEHVAWKSPATKKEVRQLEAFGLSLGLSLQDYVFHCFSPYADRRGERHKLVLDNLHQLETRALTLIEKRNASRETEDEIRALVAVGVYLHCQQDSWSHSGYGDNPLGHAIDNFTGDSPDDPEMYPDITKKALAETVEKLKAFLARLEIPQQHVSNEELARLFEGLTRGPPGPDGRWCHSKMSEYWLKKRIDAHPLLDASRVQSNVYSFTIGPFVQETTVEDGKFQTRTEDHPNSKDRRCQLVFEKTFPEEMKAAYKFTNYNFYTTHTFIERFDLTSLRLPAPRPPLLTVDIFANPGFTKRTNGYDLWQDNRPP